MASWELKEKGVDQDGKHSYSLLFYSVRRLWKNIRFSGQQHLHSASEDLFHNSLCSRIVLGEEHEEARKATDNQGGAMGEN